MKGKGYVYLTGAGCGEADLITLRGREALSGCDVVIYDDLIDEKLLSMAPPSAERIYMGKRSGAHSFPQKEITDMILRKAEEGKIVVRLKGGDSFVFGRGGEEALALQEKGIGFELIPGISSVIAIAELAGIPVTHRGLSQSFHVITAHTADTADGLPDYFDLLSRLPGTLVFVMGLSRLELIAERLINAGKAPDTPCAVVSGGNAEHPVTVRGTLSTIVEKAGDAHVLPPAVIVVGPVAALNCTATASQPLAGKTIALVGTESLCEKLRYQFRSLGADVFYAVKSRLIAAGPEMDLEKLCREQDVVVFTSSNGVRKFFDSFRTQGVDLRELGRLRFAVIGAQTGKTLASYGIRPDYCPEVYTSEALYLLLKEKLQPTDRVALYRSAMGSKELVAALREYFTVTDLAAYTVEPDPQTTAAAAERRGRTDYICFGSAGGVELYFDTFSVFPEGTQAVCIGEVTASALARYGVENVLIAPEISADSMVACVLTDCAAKNQECGE